MADFYEYQRLFNQSSAHLQGRVTPDRFSELTRYQPDLEEYEYDMLDNLEDGYEDWDE